MRRRLRRDVRVVCQHRADEVAQLGRSYNGDHTIGAIEVARSTCLGGAQKGSAVRERYEYRVTTGTRNARRPSGCAVRTYREQRGEAVGRRQMILDRPVNPAGAEEGKVGHIPNASQDRTVRLRVAPTACTP